MIRRMLISIAVLLLATGAQAQSSSMFNRARNGQYGSNQPGTGPADPAVVAQQASTPANPQQAETKEAGAGGAVAAADQQGDARSTKVAGGAGQLIGSPGEPPAEDKSAATMQASSMQAGSMASMPVLPVGVSYPAGPMIRTLPAGPAAAAHDPTVTPAAAALQQVSFTATVPAVARQYRLHDLVTIIVREETSYASDGETDLEKRASIDAKLEKWLKFRWDNPPLKAVDIETTPQLKASGGRKFEGDGTIKRKDSFVGRLTAEVVDIKPNGTLVLSARKFIKTDAEEQLFQLSGTCRVEDVTANNTVLSTQLADLAVTKTHKGAVHDSTKRGLLPWAADKVNPW